jgi:hypothetical protein
MATRRGNSAGKARAGKAGPTSSPSAAPLGTLAAVRELATLLDEYALTEVTVTRGDTTVTLRRGGAAIAAPALTAAPAPAPVSAPTPAAAAAAAPPIDPHAGAHVVKSPFVGTFYRRPQAGHAELHRRRRAAYTAARRCASSRR